jgi:hypothetical protein
MTSLSIFGTRLDTDTYVRFCERMKTTATTLRANLYKLLDQVAETGMPIDINRNGVELSLVRKNKKKKLKPLSKRIGLKGLILCREEDLFKKHYTWTAGEDL